MLSTIHASSHVLLVGINKYREPGSDLNGCVNDVNDWRKLLIGMQVPAVNIKILLDEDATKSNIVYELESLVSHSTSDHQVVVLLDNCHAGDGTRDLRNPHYRPKYRTPKVAVPPIDVQSTTINRFGFMQDAKWLSAAKRQKHLLVAACRSNQTAADAHIDGRYSGAFTASLMKTFHRKGTDLCWRTLYLHARDWLSVHGYEQVPTLEGPDVMTNAGVFDSPFILFCNSSHGSQVPDTTGHESDHRTEILYPYDGDQYWDDPLSDDVLAAILKKAQR